MKLQQFGCSLGILSIHFKEVANLKKHDIIGMIVLYVVIGVVASALAIGATLYLLDTAWGFGSEELAAPQATLMKIIVEL